MIRFPRIPLPRLALLALLLAWGEAWLEVAWISAGIRSNHEEAVRLHVAAGESAIRKQFARAAGEVDGIARRLASSKEVRAGLARPEREGSRELFDAVLEPGGAGVEAGGIEVIRAEGAVVAWNGITPVPGGSGADPARATRRLEAGAVHVWYVTTVPVRAEGKSGALLGAVRVGVPVEAREGLHARFRRVRTLSDAAQEVGVKGARVRAVPSGAVARGTEGAWTRAPLEEKDSALGGLIEIPGPSDEDLFDAAGHGARLRGRLLSAALLVAACIALGRFCARPNRLPHGAPVGAALRPAPA